MIEEEYVTDLSGTSVPVFSMDPLSLRYPKIFNSESMAEVAVKMREDLARETQEGQGKKGTREGDTTGDPSDSSTTGVGAASMCESRMRFSCTGIWHWVWM